MPAKIAVVFWSLYGHTLTLAEEVATGLREIPDVEVEVLQVKETLSDEVLGKMHAGPKTNHRIISAADLPQFDGYAFGIPTRYGRAPHQFDTLFDSTGQLWASGALVGKYATVFTGSASQHGGQETTALTVISNFVHHGINFVPIGFGASELSDLSEIVGGSAYGAASISKGDGSRAVSEKEKAIAHYQGRHFGKIVASSVRGRDMPVATAHHSSGAKEAALGTGAATAGLATGGAVAASNLPAAIPYSLNSTSSFVPATNNEVHHNNTKTSAVPAVSNTRDNPTPVHSVSEKPNDGYVVDGQTSVDAAKTPLPNGTSEKPAETVLTTHKPDHRVPEVAPPPAITGHDAPVGEHPPTVTPEITEQTKASPTRAATKPKKSFFCCGPASNYET